MQQMWLRKEIGVIEKLVTFCFLGINAWHDYKKKEIFLWSVGVYVVFGIRWGIWQKTNWQEYVFAVVMGGILTLLSVGTKGSIGMGDVWVILALGLVMEHNKYLLTILLAFLESAIFSAMLLMLKKVGRKTEIPFLPFLFIAYVGGMCLW